MRKLSFPVALAVLVSACSTGSPSGSDTTATLTVVSWKGGGTELAGLPELNAAFEKAHPDIKLQFKYVSAEYHTYNNSRLAAGDAADVLMVDRQKMLRWTKQGYLADLGDQSWVPRLNRDLKYFNSVKDKTYQLNGENIAIGLYANLDLLRSAGVNRVAQTWPELIADLQTLKAKEVNGFLLPNKGGWMGEQLALALAANLVEPEWANKYDTGGSNFNPSWAPVVERIKELFDAELVDPKLMLGLDANNDGVPQFKAGKWAYIMQGAWALNDMSKGAKFEFSFNALPGGAAGSKPKTFTFVGTGWAVNSKAKHPDAAKAYIEFMAKPENAAAYLKAESAFSTLKDVQTPVIAKAQPAVDAFTAGDTIPSPAQILNFNDAETQIQKAIEVLFAKPDTPVADVLELLDQQIPKTPLD